MPAPPHERGAFAALRGKLQPSPSRTGPHGANLGLVCSPEQRRNRSIWFIFHVCFESSIHESVSGAAAPAAGGESKQAERTLSSVSHFSVVKKRKQKQKPPVCVLLAQTSSPGTSNTGNKEINK